MKNIRNISSSNCEIAVATAVEVVESEVLTVEEYDSSGFSSSQIEQNGIVSSAPMLKRARSKRVTNTNLNEYFTPPNEEAGKQFLMRNNWPSGLQDALIKSCKKYPIRFILVDDSGSMMTNDGHKLVKVGGSNNMKMINCTRWSESVASMQFHAELAKALNAPTEFRLLNHTNGIMVGGGPASSEGFNKLIAALQESPSGQTPICGHIREITATIQEMEPSLRFAGQKACVLIVTDGEATDGDILEAMRPLQRLPVWVVVRLCTDEDKIVKYWNDLDRQLELDIDVLDDLTGEAEEVNRANPWLVYSDCMHRFREFGSIVKEMCVLDEAPLSSEQMRTICNLLVIGNSAAHTVPHPDEDWTGFYNLMKVNVNKHLFWDPVSKKMKPPIDFSNIYCKAQNSHSCLIS